MLGLKLILACLQEFYHILTKKHILPLEKVYIDRIYKVDNLWYLKIKKNKRIIIEMEEIKIKEEKNSINMVIHKVKYFKEV